MKIKICGVTTISDLLTLDSLGVDLGGIWWGIPRGKHNMETDNVLNILSVPTYSLEMVLVTLSNDIGSLAMIADKTLLKGIQLQGFHTPGFVRNLKASLPEHIKLYKVLHVNQQCCLEENFIERYVTAGIDHFILDTFLSRDQIGSTGVGISVPVLQHLLERIVTESVFIAGGISAGSIDWLSNYTNVCGVDIDSGARQNGKISIGKVKKIKASLHENLMLGV